MGSVVGLSITFQIFETSAAFSFNSFKFHPFPLQFSIGHIQKFLKKNLFGIVTAIDYENDDMNGIANKLSMTRDSSFLVVSHLLLSKESF